MTHHLAQSNATIHVEIQFADGETFFEKHRDSWGGFLNMLNRVAERNDTTRYDVRSAKVGDEVVFTLPNTRTFTVTEVQAA